ncbi:HalOD1 output domain-containing protein [Natronococcus sp. A-GB7]|uniref:HalOD1 output domain-containing protein n=1 Tax=Natronococcus sp. A-GB7 TaxID=3037649 RepID=UPI00241D83D5|nr:HalOD1 output domain-containing protein [Natronococcus sp. A-GB7]MDG5821424.1 hypothetical protein [Natronococcus sp. A-GB7]
MSDSLVQQTSADLVTEQSLNHEMTPVVAVVSAVADAAGTDPFELPPLSNAINPEALNDLIGTGQSSGLESVSFEYVGYDIVVSGTGDIQVTPSE